MNFSIRPSTGPGSSDETDEIHNKFMSVVFTLIGTTQGLALSALADKIPKDLELLALRDALLSLDLWAALRHAEHDFVRLSSFALCFFIIARVTQTYICGALSYVQKIFSFWDLTSILAIGVLQYAIMNSLPTTGTEVGNLYLKLYILAICAIILHAYAAWKELKHGDAPYPVKMQIYNMLFSFAIFVLSFLAHSAHSELYRSILSTSISAVIAINIMLSLANTDFSGRTREIWFKAGET